MFWCGRVSCAAALDNLADGITCGDRMQWLRTDAGGAHTELSACTRVAVTEYPTTCGDCAPEAGGGEPLRAADLRPRVVQLQGCSFSTVVIYQLTHVLASMHLPFDSKPAPDPMASVALAISGAVRIAGIAIDRLVLVVCALRLGVCVLITSPFTNFPRAGLQDSVRNKEDSTGTDAPGYRVCLLLRRLW